MYCSTTFSVANNIYADIFDFFPDSDSDFLLFTRVNAPHTHSHPHAHCFPTNRPLAHIQCMREVVSVKAPGAVAQHFCESLFYLNACTAHATFNQVRVCVKESLSGQRDEREKRVHA